MFKNDKGISSGLLSFSAHPAIFLVPDSHNKKFHAQIPFVKVNHHPVIVICEPREFDSRCSKYWTDRFSTDSHPVYHKPLIGIICHSTLVIALRRFHHYICPIRVGHIPRNITRVVSRPWFEIE